jgi:protein SCO1
MRHQFRARPMAVAAGLLAAGVLAAAVLAAGVALWRGSGAEAGPEPFAEATSANGTTAAPAADRGRGGSVWGAGYFPNVTLVTHEGERVRFFADMIEGKVVLINFVYTSCPDTCPMETARLLDVARILGDRLGDDVFFYSITVDPETDTPDVLADFAAAWGIPDGWKFVTGDPDDLALVRRKLGVDMDDIESLTLSQHPINLVMGNQATGRWMKRSPFENSYVLAEQVGRWLHNWKLPSAEERDYADAPEIRQISSGEDLYRTRCAACHTVGGGDVRELAERRIGPDLYNVGETRDREWLKRWIAEPDAMLEAGDPLALALYAEYEEIPMPNLRLTDTEVEQILGYLDQESRRITALRSGEHPGGHQHHAGHGGQEDHAGHASHGGQAAEPRSEPAAPAPDAEHAGHTAPGGVP